MPRTTLKTLKWHIVHYIDFLELSCPDNDYRFMRYSWDMHVAILSAGIVSVGITGLCFRMMEGHSPFTINHVTTSLSGVTFLLAAAAGMLFSRIAHDHFPTLSRVWEQKMLVQASQWPALAAAPFIFSPFILFLM